MKPQKSQLNEVNVGSNLTVQFIERFSDKSIDIENILQNIIYIIPSSFLIGIDSIIVGDFDSLNKRDLVAMFSDGSIFVSSKINSSQLLFESIIHEIGHSILFEDTFAQDIFLDDLIHLEYKNKRTYLYNLLNQYYKVPFAKHDFQEAEYSVEIDKFLYQDIGYEALYKLTYSFIVNPYSITSLDEYFAGSFENYYTGAKDELKSISPVVYEKIRFLEKKY